MPYFKAGQVAAHFTAWRTLTNDKILLSHVLGAAVECIATPVQHKLPNQIFSEHEYPIVRQEVRKLLEKRVITKVSPIPGQILSNVFLRPKKDGTHRLILNRKRFNESVSHYHFKMDSLSTITKLVSQNCYMASVDIKDAYYSIPIRSSDGKCLRFIWEGELYEFTCLPNGLSCAPRISGAPNDNFRKNICSEDDLRSRIFETFVVKFLACLPLLGFSNIQKMVYLPIFNGFVP